MQNHEISHSIKQPVFQKKHRNALNLMIATFYLSLPSLFFFAVLKRRKVYYKEDVNRSVDKL